MTHPKIRLPAGPVTPAGAYHILHDRIPQVALRSFDDTVVFHLMGGLAIPDRTMPERVEIKTLKGLVPPWQTIDQKGATQDGITFVDALYDPIEVEMDVVCHGRNPTQCRKVGRTLIDSIDAKRTSELSWFTHEMGRWWAAVRWFKTPDNMDMPAMKRQPKSLRLRADMGFWQSYPDVAEFRFGNIASDDFFETDVADGLSADWTLQYTSGGSGHIFVDNGQIESTLSGKGVVARHNTYTSPTDNQEVAIRIGRIGQWFFPSNVAMEIWTRMPSSGTVGQEGTFLRIERHKLSVISIHTGIETVLRTKTLIIPPLSMEKWSLIAGKPTSDATDVRKFTVLRGNLPVWTFKETGTTSQIGSGFRRTGLGLRATGTVTMPGIMAFEAGGNAVDTQSGFVRRINAGDQEAWDEVTCFGPGTFRIGNGPGSDEMVEFGPLTSQQVAVIRTDPRKYGVKDLTVIPNTPTEQNQFNNALTGILSLVTLNPITHILDVFASITGLFNGGSAPVPPQGNLYALLKGRFSNPIPPKSPGEAAKEYHVKAEIAGGDANSMMIFSLIPLRRYPF